MKNEILKKFEKFYENEKPQTPQFIKYLLKNLGNPDFINEVVGEYPIYKKSTDFWNNKFWKRQILSFFELLNTENFHSLLEYYCSQKNCSNIPFLQYAFKKDPNITIEILCANKALAEPNHLRTIIRAEKFEFVFSKRPKESINGLRTTELFLDSGLWSEIEKVLQSNNTDFFDYYLTFKDLRNRNQSFIDQIEKNAELFNDSFKVFYHLSLWHEKNIFFNKKNETISPDFDLSMLALYNFILDKCQCENINSDILTQFDLQREVFVNHNEQEKYQALFCLIYEYVKFKSDILEFFCFDKNAIPVRDQEGNLVLKPQNDNKETLWVRNGMKYEYWNSYYILKGGFHYRTDMERDLLRFKSLYKDKEEFNLQSEFHATQFRNKLFFEDLNLSDYKLKCSTPLYHIVNNMEALRANVVKKELDCKEAIMSKSKDFEDYCSNLGRLKIDNCFVRLENYEDLVKKCMALSMIDRDMAQSILNFHTIELNSCDMQKRIDLKPIIRIGNICIILPWLIRMITPAISTLNGLIDNTELKNEFGDIVENQVRKEFKDCKFSIKGFDQKDFDQIDKNGNYDCLAYKDGVLFVVQVKSTYIRASLKDNYLFTEREILKAKNQIDKNLIDLKNNFDIIRDKLAIKEASLSQLKIFPLIITTSFEKDGETFVSSYDPTYKIHKTSLFELQILLRGEEQNLFDCNELLQSNVIPQYKPGRRCESANEIIDTIENKRAWTKLESTPIPLNKNYYTISNSAAEQLCDESIKEYSKGNVDNALLLILEAIKGNSSNPKFYCHLGDINFDLKKLDSAIECYNKSVDLDNTFVDAWYNLSQIYLQKKLLPLAYVCLVKVLELNPNDRDAKTNLTLIESFFNRNPELANKMHEMLIQGYPKN